MLDGFTSFCQEFKKVIIYWKSYTHSSIYTHLVKYLIIRFSSIGDIVLTTPVIRCLKQQVDGAEIHFLTKRNYKDVLACNPYIDKLHLLDHSLSNLILVLKEEKFDYIIDLHHNLRSAIVKARLGAISFSFNKINVPKWLMVNLKINRLPHKHIVDRYFDTLALFDVRNDQKGLDFFYAPEDEVKFNELPEALRNGYVAFIIGAKHATKKLPLEKIARIIRKSALPYAIIGGREDEQDGAKICAEAEALCVNLAGKLSIGQSAAFVNRARVVITHDTGMMHIAAAFHKKIISIWGNTIPGFGMTPYKANNESIIAEVKGLNCRPCSKIGYASCPKKHFKCMNDIDEDEIIRITKKLW